MREQKEKILFFDSWCIGAKFMQPVLKKLNGKYETTLVTFDSLKEKSSDEVKNNISQFKSGYGKDALSDFSKIHDMQEFSYSAKKAITTLNPKVIVFITLHGFEHRYFNEVAEMLGVPCIMYMHGVRGIKLNIGVNTYLNQASRKLKSVSYYSKLYAKYFSDVGLTNNNLGWHISRYLKLIIKHYYFIQRPKIDAGMSYRVVHVTCENDIAYYEDSYGIKPRDTQFKVIGHIDAEMFLEKDKFSIDEGTLLYVSQPVVHEKLVTEENYRFSVQEAKNSARKMGLNFIFRPHPRDDFEYIKALQEDIGFTISKNDLFYDVSSAKVIAGINSTVMFTAQTLKKPLLIFNFIEYPVHPSLMNYEYGVLINGQSNTFDIEKIMMISTTRINSGHDKIKIMSPVEEICASIESI